MNASALPELRLRRKEDLRLRAGHLWIFSNEVDTAATPLTAFTPGDQARVLDGTGKPLGIAYVNPRSLIAARIVSRDATTPLGEPLLAQRLDTALALRERLGVATAGRLVFGESDRLPGLVVDRLGATLIGQCTTAGMERHADAVAELLRERTDATGMLWRNDTGVRELEGLAQEVRVAWGDVPERLSFREGPLSLSVDSFRSQKTGWFFDQRQNRERLGPYVARARVLDLFCYGGAWGLRAAIAGARAVTCVDAGEQAVADSERNVEANDLGDRVRVVRSDAFRFLEQALADGERYDVVVLDPPAFAKRKKDVKPALKAYRRLNELALRLVERDGILVTCSCSFHVRGDVFDATVAQAARHVDRYLQRLERLQQAADHPVHPAIPETDYLKGAIYRVSWN